MQVREEGKAEACLVRVLPFRQGPVRFVALVVLALTAVGELYTFNIPQAIEESFKEQLEISESQFELLYTYYALPNIFTTVLLGAFMDIVGIRIGVVLMACTLAIGQSVCAFGAGIDSFGTILAGRVIAGISAESLMTAQTALVCLWFAGQ
jgi:MFS family permease